MAKPLWVEARAISFKISPVADLAGRVGGDWDMERRHPIESTIKFRSIRQHFADGRPWEETDLFGLYAQRFEEDSEIRGATSIEALAAQYYERVDGLHEDMRRNGFKVEQELETLPGLLIGRDAEIFIGNQGNHRLAIAWLLDIRIAGRVACRHELAR